MKKFKTFLFVLLLVPLAFLFTGCSFFSEDKVYVTNLEQVQNADGTTTLIAYYSNGTTSTFNVKNGKDGQDGANANLEDIKAYIDANSETLGYTFEDWLNERLQSDIIENSIKNSLKSVVSVYAGSSAGSGVIYSIDDENDCAYIITNHHVVYSAITSSSASNIYVFQYGTNEGVWSDEMLSETCSKSGAIKSTCIGSSMYYDIAILKVKASDLKLINPNVAQTKVASNYSIGESCYAIGNNLGSGIMATSGIVSKESYYEELELVDNSGTYSYRVLVSDTPINEGNSGCGLFNAQSELIGIVNSKTGGTKVDNRTYALPIDNVTLVADNIIDEYNRTGTTAQVKKLYLGISFTAYDFTAEYDESGEDINVTCYSSIKVTNVSSGYAGARLGLKVNDIIESVFINGEEYKITQYFQFSDYMLKVRDGDSVSIKITRNGKSQISNSITVDGDTDLVVKTANN